MFSLQNVHISVIESFIKISLILHMVRPCWFIYCGFEDLQLFRGWNFLCPCSLFKTHSRWLVQRFYFSDPPSTVNTENSNCNPRGTHSLHLGLPDLFKMGVPQGSSAEGSTPLLSSLPVSSLVDWMKSRVPTEANHLLSRRRAAFQQRRTISKMRINASLFLQLAHVQGHAVPDSDCQVKHAKYVLWS